jgi:hypothetical protein
MNRPIVALAALISAMATIVAAIKLLLRVPGIPYNVAELFLNGANIPALIFFALTLLWIGAGAMVASRLLMASRRPWLLLPLVVVGVSLVSKMLVSRAVTYESLDDILGSNNMFGLVAQNGIWGEGWRHLFLRVGVDTVDFVERRVRYCALYSTALLPLVVALMPPIRRRIAGYEWRQIGLLAVTAVTWLWICTTIVLTWAATDNLTELIASHGPAGVPGPLCVFAISVVLAANVAAWVAVGSVETAIGGMIATAVALPLTWTLLGWGLEQHVHKYGVVFSGVQFLLGPDRRHALTAATLFARWCVVYLGAVATIAVGARLAALLLPARPPISAASAPVVAS